jgi:hypothetical protein
MRPIFLILCFLFIKTLQSQTTISDTKRVWRFTYYDFAGNLSKEGFFTDTLYTIQKFPVTNDWKIYFDTKRTIVATLIHYDSTNKILTSRHYKRDGKLIWEFCTRYKNKKNCNPLLPRLKEFKYLKIFQADSLICEMTGQEQLIAVKYRNHFTNDFSDQTMYFSSVDSWRDEFIGSDVWKYYENGNLKSICKTLREDDETGTILFLKCKSFDQNGCIIPDK